MRVFHKSKLHFLFFLSIVFFNLSAFGQISGTEDSFIKESSNGHMELSIEGADFLSNLALECIQKEYPNKLNQQLKNADDLKSPAELHPAFYGCYDWHSAVHGHWMLIRLLKMYPEMEEADLIQKRLNENLQPENIAQEVLYFQGESKSFERMYGWSWLLKLAEELLLWEDPQAQQWYKNLKPLTDLIVDRYQEFLVVQRYPVRTGVHPNTAFGLSFALDYAISAELKELEWLIRKSALSYFLEDESCPASWEPSGEDFLSPCLEEANLMRKVLDKNSFNKWFEDFLDKSNLKSLFIPADVSDRSDPKIVHLDGLNLSRAWSFYGIASVMENDRLENQLIKAANDHLEATLPHVASSHYEGAHWLGSFAVYALSIRNE